MKRARGGKWRFALLRTRGKNILKASLLFVAAFLLAAIVFEKPAWAMHIAEGILPPGWAIFWFLLATPLVVMGFLLMKRASDVDRSFLPRFALMGALIFIISVIPIPVPVSGSCSHPCGTPLGAIIVGPFASTAMGFIALLIQALFLAHGGLSTLGANVFSMAVVGSLVGYGVYRMAKKTRMHTFLSAFLAGFVGDLCVYLATAFQLSLALEGEKGFLSRLGTIYVAFLPTQLPLAALEGLLTAFVLVAIMQRNPEILTARFLPLGKYATNMGGERVGKD